MVYRPLATWRRGDPDRLVVETLRPTLSESIFAARSKGACEPGVVKQPTSGERLLAKKPGRTVSVLAPHIKRGRCSVFPPA